MTRPLVRGDSGSLQQLVQVVSSYCMVVQLMWEFITKLGRGSCRVEEKIFTAVFVEAQSHQCSATRLQELIPSLLEISKSEDAVFACSIGLHIALLVVGSPARIPELMASAFPRAMWETQCRIAAPGQSAAWWKERCDVVHLDSLCLISITGGQYNLLKLASSVPREKIWDDVLSEAVHLLKVNQAAELSAEHNHKSQVP